MFGHTKTMMIFENEDIVISGVGGLFPKSGNIEEFGDNLLKNEVLTESRWKAGELGVTNVIGTIPVEYFDNAYFGIHRQQCTFMDPMQRSILERTFEALLDAGVNPNDLKGRRIGCYMGSSIGENDNYFYESVVSGFGVTGHSRAMMPNRVSYWLNLKGPSVAYDSNWISGIEVIRLAYDAIKSGLCESVIVGTANLALNSELQWVYNDMGVLSPDGSTKAFDADAKGYARSDGVVVLYIQRASQAKRSYASIVNVATRFNGMREGTLLDVDVPSMVQFMEDFYKKCNVNPKDVEFVEAYGCGNKVIDKAEIDAFEKVYCKDRKKPLLVGSVKTNTGHSEASASLFSIVKVLIAMERGIIPANLQYDKPNPEITPLVDGTVQIVTENTKWDGKYAAVNGIGLDSYYGHVLLKSNCKDKRDENDELPQLILASTRTESGIKAILETIKNKKVDHEYCKLLHDVFSKPILGHLYRGYSLIGKEIKQESEYHMGNKRQTWFVYSGMGSQWCGMASDLMKIEVFANAINKCHEVLKPKGVDLINIITTDDKKIFDNILHSFIGIAAIQIGLTDILRAIGIVPDGIIGHSVGELGCAYADGCLTAEQMILSAYSRGRASLEAELIPGMMAAIGMGYQQIKDQCPPSIEVACHNGPDSSTISGPTEDMEKFVKELQDKGIFARLVNVSNIAYHSRYIKPAAPLLLKYLKEVIPESVARSPKWVSTSNLEENWDTDLAKHSSAEYHTNNLLSSVLFEEGLKHIPKDSVLIEIAPHGLLQAILKRSLKSGCTNVPLTQRASKSGVEFMFNSFGKLYLAGLDMNLSPLFPKVEYPVSKGTPSLASLVHWEHSEYWRTGYEDKLQALFGVRDVQVTLNSEEFRDCVGHQLDERIIVPTSSYLFLVYNIVKNIISSENKDIVFENLHFRKVLTIPKIGSVPLHAMIQKGSGIFEILSRNDILVTGRITFPSPTDKFLIEPSEIELSEDNVQLSGSDIYNELQHRGHNYSGLYKSIKSLTITEEGSVSTIQWNNKWTMFLEAMIQQNLLQSGERNQDIQVPKTIQKIVISENLLPTEKKDLKVTYDYSANLICTDGAQISGLRTITLPKEKRPTYFNSFEIVPLNDMSYPAMENGINIALQLMLDNFEDQYVTNVMVTELESDNPSIAYAAKNVFSQLPKFNPNITSVKDVKQIIVQTSYPLLVISNDTVNEELAKLVASSHSFLLVRADKSLLNYPQIIQVAQFTVNGTSYSVMRKTNNIDPAIVLVKGDTLSIKDLTRQSVSWVTELTAAVSIAKAKCQSVFLVSSNIPTEGFTNFINELSIQPNMIPLRVLFTLDKRVNELNRNEYRHIFKQDLKLSIIKDGVYNSYISIPAALKENIHLNITTNTPIIKNRTINYISVNLKDITILPNNYKKPKLGNIDYCGVTNTGQKIMGLAYMDRDTCKLVPDSTLVWDVSENMPMEDAVTIPYAYTAAFYALFQKAKVVPGETVLIHAGCSAIGLAAISIAGYHGCTVYTTVANDHQRAYIRKQFQFMKDHMILSSEDTSFEPYFMMATGGIGAHVILNCLSGSLLQASLACLGDYGRFIQLGKFDLEENNTIGMRTFLRNTSFYSVNVDSVFELPQEAKDELKQLLDHGLEKLSVRPLYRKIVDHQDIDSILSNLSQSSNIGKILIRVNNNFAINKLSVTMPNQFICDAKSSYLVYGGTAELWTDVTEWLVLRGARKIIVSSESKPQQVHINRRLSLLQSYFGADIIFAASKAHTREGASELLSEVYFLGPIHGVFLLPNKNSVSRTSDIKPVQYIDYALRTTAPKALFVNYISSAAGICHLRAEAGYCTYNVQWEKNVEVTDNFCGLDEILQMKVRNVLIKIDKTSDSKEETTQALFKKLTLMLPPSVDVLTEQTKLAPKEPELIQMTTQGPREMRELAPVFIIPGISGQTELQEFAFELLYPTFCTILPSTPMTIQQLAVEYASKIKKIWPKGAYNIVGISWGGALAIEIARILDQQGGSIHLYFIDAAPQTLQSAVKHLGEEATTMEVNLLTRVLNINDVEVIKKMEAATDWDSCVKLALDNYNGQISDRNTLINGLFILRKRLQHLVSYQPTDEVVSGQIHLIRPEDSSKYDNCGLLSYCKQTPQITLVSGDHLSIINNKDTAEYINEKHYLI